jgi:hypothetical protein
LSLFFLFGEQGSDKVRNVGRRPMIRTNQLDPFVLDEAHSKIVKGLSVEIEITGSQARKLARAFHHYLSCLDTTRSDAQRKTSFLKWVFFAPSLPPTLWTICNRARLNGMTVEGLIIRKFFVIKFGNS